MHADMQPAFATGACRLVHACYVQVVACQVGIHAVVTHVAQHTLQGYLLVLPYWAWLTPYRPLEHFLAIRDLLPSLARTEPKPCGR
jgi:hypothetical protein